MKYYYFTVKLNLMSNHALRIIKQGIVTRAKFLNLGNCGLNDRDFEENGSIITGLAKCSDIEVLILSNETYGEDRKVIKYEQPGGRNYFTEFPHSLRILSHLRTLYFNGSKEQPWKLNDLSFAKDFKNLRELDVSFNNIEKIEISIGFPSLTKFYASNNKIKSFDDLSLLCNLEELDLSNNKIDDISPLSNMKDLKRLFLSNNQISSYLGLKQLSYLQELHLNENNANDLTGLGKLDNLKILHFEKNRLRNLNVFKNLKSLEQAYLRENGMISIAGIENLKAIKLLDIANNKIDILDGIEQLDQLELIDFSSNEISDIEPLLPLLERSVDMENNNLVSHYRKIKRNVFIFQDNPLIIPPVEIVQQGARAILNYFGELVQQGTEYLYEAKMLIVGQPRAGKTTLRYKLFDINGPLPDEDETTRGIDIQRLSMDIIDRDGKPREFFYNIWDFGGQHIYQTTHQFFLTHRSLYVLVMDTGKDSIGNDDTTINYWLQVVELLGDNSPIIIVRNEKNERQINIDMAQKRVRFDFVKNDYGIDMNALIKGDKKFRKEKAEDFLRLKEDIEIELKRLPLVGFPMPKNWVMIRNQLQEFSTKTPYISKKEFMQLCAKNGVSEYEKQIELSRIFHDLGIFLHFQDYGVALDDFIILRNTWATDAVFAVLDNPKVKFNKGRFTDQDLADIWKNQNYEPLVHKKLLALMMQFELCYQVDRSSPNVYIIPEMLEDSPPIGYSWDIDNDLPVQYKYDFMPKGILTRLIVRLHTYLNVKNRKQVVWKTGANIDGTNLSCPRTEAEITEAWDNKQLDIRVKGHFSKDLMSKITMIIDELNNQFFRDLGDGKKPQKSRWYKMIPCNCVSCKNNSDKYFYDYNELLDRKTFGKLTIECKKKPFMDVNIIELLDGVFVKNNGVNIKTADRKIIKIFLASSSELKTEREQFEIFINRENKRLHESGIFLRLDIWEDFLDVMSQESLQGEYNKVIQGCDVFVMLFFTKVGIFTAEEFEVAFGQFKKDDKPKILTYFKKGNISSTDLKRNDTISLFDFHDRLKTLGHFYTSFENVQELQLHFKKQMENLYAI